MKKFLRVAICLVFFCSGAYLFATASEQAEEYDEDTYGPEAPIIWTQPVKAVVFHHKTHTMDQEIDCDSCHDDLFEMEAGIAEEEDDFTMESLYEGRYCGACHDGDTAFASDTRCASCHIGVRGLNRLEGSSKEE